MCTKDIIQPLVGTKNIAVKDLFLDAKSSDLIISAWPTKEEWCRCGLCHRKAKYYDAGRALDIGVGKVFIEAPAPRVCCKKHGVVVAAVPWARHDSRRSAVSELLRIEWHTVGGICGRVYKELEAAGTSRYDGLANIGIDETSYKKELQ